MPLIASQGDQVTVYRFRMFDIRSGEFVESRRWAPADLIEDIHAERIGEGVQIERSALAADGLTPHGVDPRPREGGFPRSVSSVQRP